MGAAIPTLEIPVVRLMFPAGMEELGEAEFLGSIHKHAPTYVRTPMDARAQDSAVRIHS